MMHEYICWAVGCARQPVIAETAFEARKLYAHRVGLHVTDIISRRKDLVDAKFDRLTTGVH